MSIQTRFNFSTSHQIRTRICAAKTAYQHIWNQFAPPTKFGKVIQMLPQNMQGDCIQEAWHGGSFRNWERQILEGKVDNRTRNLFFGNIELATQYALIHNDPILIHLRIKSGVILIDETYGTDYVQGKSPSEVLIARAYHVNDAYIRFIEDEYKPKPFHIHKMAARAAIKGFINTPNENLDLD